MAVLFLAQNIEITKFFL